MSAVHAGYLDRHDTASAASRANAPAACRGRRADLQGGGRMAELEQTPSQDDSLMTLLSPCQPPRHSKWHLASGVVVVLTIYAVAMLGVRWLIAS
jgi:hypothetical protein